MDAGMPRGRVPRPHPLCGALAATCGMSSLELCGVAIVAVIAAGCLLATNIACCCTDGQRPSLSSAWTYAGPGCPPIMGMIAAWPSLAP